MFDQKYIPRPGPTYQIGELAAFLGNADAFYETAVGLEVRSVAVRSQDRWHNFGTSLGIVGFEKHDRERADFRDLVLLKTTVAANTIASVDELRKLLAAWRIEVETDSGYSFQDNTYVDRFPSRNRFSDGTPGWFIRLTERTPDRPHHQPPEGPFLNVNKNLYAESTAALAAEWLGLNYYLNHNTIQHEYTATIPDPRGKITRLVAEGQQLKVSLDQRTSPLFCAATRHGVLGDQERQVTEAKNGAAELNFTGGVRNLEVFLLTSDGEWLDKYHEDERGSGWGESLYNERKHKGPIALEAALASGESDTVEFKPFIRPTRGNDKAVQLLRTVVAFGNRDGGNIFIGVSDDIEPIGVDPDLRKEYAADCQGDEACMEESYIRELQKFFAEGTDPLPPIAMEWLRVAHVRILQVNVGPSPRIPSTLALSGDIYTRVGGNNRKLRQDEIPKYFPSLSR